MNESGEMPRTVAVIAAECSANPHISGLQRENAENLSVREVGRQSRNCAK